MSRSVTDPRLCFVAEHFDTLAGLVRNFQLLFFYQDYTVEITDLDTRKTFLKRSECKNLTRGMFYIGGEVVVFGRLLKLVSYGDGLTKQLCAARDHKTVCILGESHLEKLGSSVSLIQVECNFAIRHMVSAVLSKDDLEAVGAPTTFAGQNVVVFLLVREEATAKGVAMARRLGRDAWCPDSDESAAAATAIYDVARKKTSANLNDDGSSSVVVIKNHIVANGDGGDVISRLLAQTGLTVSAVAQVTLSGHEADSFLNVYKGVLEDYRSTVEDLSSGNVWVAQLVGAGSSNVVDVVRDACGPFDPLIAKTLRPKSIRAVYGADRVHNAVHCSDLQFDGADNAEFFFCEIASK